MELHKLRYFYTAAQFLHITRAAKSIGIAQPALTQSIHSLEEELGVPLFARKGRNIALTKYGEFLKKKLDQLLPEIDRIPQEINRMKGEKTPTVKLNILAASAWVIRAIVEYHRLHPDVTFDFEQNREKEDCDVVITTGAGTQESPHGCKKSFVQQEDIFLAVPRKSPYAGRESIDLAEVKDEPFVMLSNSRLFGVICNHFCQEAGFQPHILFESDSPSAVQNIISSGAGIAFWPEYSWGDVENESVVMVPVSHPACHRDLIIELYDRGEDAVQAEAFYGYLSDLLQGQGQGHSALGT